MGKFQPSPLPKSKNGKPPEPPSDSLYFQAKKTVLDYEIHEFTRSHNFIALEDSLHEYGEFLERHPEADKGA